jgi:hypothetical protein
MTASVHGGALTDEKTKVSPSKVCLDGFPGWRW